jgi:hypothetical protein
MLCGRLYQEVMKMANEFEINYEDERFKEVEEQKNAALAENENIYNEAIDSVNQQIMEQNQAAKDWADKQSQLQQERTDFEVEKLEQQKQQAEKDYQREQSGAYVDWQKQSNKYGVNAEKMAAAGLDKSGYSESAEVAMYTAYQNRVATARASYQLAVQNFDNAMREAKLNNSSIQAEIAFNALQKQLELAVQNLQIRNQYLLDKANKKLAIDDLYYGRRQDVLAQILQENALAAQLKGSSGSGVAPIINKDAATVSGLSGALVGSLNSQPASNIGALVGDGAKTAKDTTGAGSALESTVVGSASESAKKQIENILKLFGK